MRVELVWCVPQFFCVRFILKIFYLIIINPVFLQNNGKSRSIMRNIYASGIDTEYAKKIRNIGKDKKMGNERREK